jgi:hypothetical protein
MVTVHSPEPSFGSFAKLPPLAKLVYLEAGGRGTISGIKSSEKCWIEIPSHDRRGRQLANPERELIDLFGFGRRDPGCVQSPECIE